jgi:hypothetical protein
MVCITGAGVGVDSAWKQKKPEARKLLDARRAAESPASSVCFLHSSHIGHPLDKLLENQKIELCWSLSL